MLAPFRRSPVAPHERATAVVHELAYYGGRAFGLAERQLAVANEFDNDSNN